MPIPIHSLRPLAASQLSLPMRSTSVNFLQKRFFVYGFVTAFCQRFAVTQFQAERQQVGGFDVKANPRSGSELTRWMIGNWSSLIRFSRRTVAVTDDSPSCCNQRRHQ